MVPAGTPEGVVKKLSLAMNAALTEPAVVRAFIADEIRKWAEVVRVSGATLN